MDISLLSLSEGELYFLIAAFGLSVYAIQCYWTGMGMTKFKRALEDTPRCKINTGAVGTNVEIQGFVLADDLEKIHGDRDAWWLQGLP